MQASFRVSLRAARMDALAYCVLVLVQFIFTANTQWTLEDEVCRTPDQGIGTCVAVHTCKPMNDLLDNIPQPIPASITTLLRSYHCGVEGRTPKVCCPSKPIQIPILSSASKPSSSKPSSSPPKPPVVSSHKNYDLLPKNCGLMDTTDRIVFGNKTSLFEFPWMALLSYKTRTGPDFKCGATIISERYVLTAAHCLIHNGFQLLGVRIGEHNINTKIDCEILDDGEQICAPPYQDLAVEEIIPHPRYDRRAHTNDIGLVRVASRIDITLEHIRAVCLPVDNARTYNFADRTLVVAGWGATETKSWSPDLLKAEILMVPLEECKKTYKNLANTEINYLQLCAGGSTPSDSCAGDSGGPLHSMAPLYGENRFVQQGVVSFGPKPCGKKGVPGIYTKVVYYMDWILDSMKP